MRATSPATLAVSRGDGPRPEATRQIVEAPRAMPSSTDSCTCSSSSQVYRGISADEPRA